MLSTAFPGISANTPEILVPLALIAAPFAIALLIGLGTSFRDWLFRRG